MDYFVLARNFILLFICGWITYTDIKRHEIDHTPLIVGTLFIIPINLLGLNEITFTNGLLTSVLMFILFYIMTFFGMGGGDLKLMTMIGLFLGFGQGMVVVVVSIYVSAIYAIFFMLFKRNKKYLKHKIPMGPFISIGTFFAIYFYNFFLQFVSNNIVTF